MKVWIDKQGGMHYHREDCRMLKSIPPTKTRLNPIQFHYEPIDRQLRGNSLFGYKDIIVDGNHYSSCPICFEQRRY